VAYFEGFNPSRPCLNLDIGDLDMSPYTHIHMAFATLTPDFKIDISNIEDQFSKFVSMTAIGQKRILSIGGWAFSTSPDTYMIFRNAVQEANWDIVSSNIVDFITVNGLDGVDIDWYVQLSNFS
jgi:chitinase